MCDFYGSSHVIGCIKMCANERWLFVDAVCVCGGGCSVDMTPAPQPSAGLRGPGQFTGLLVANTCPSEPQLSYWEQPRFNDSQFCLFRNFHHLTEAGGQGKICQVHQWHKEDGWLLSSGRFSVLSKPLGLSPLPCLQRVLNYP